MGAIKSIVGAIQTRMTALGFVLTDDVFDFEVIPSSIAHKAYRIDSKQSSCRYDSGNIATAIESIEIYILYEVQRNARTMRDTALDDRETIEKDLINNATISALASDPILTMDGEASEIKEREGFMVSRLVFNCDYLRDIAP